MEIIYPDYDSEKYLKTQIQKFERLIREEGHWYEKFIRIRPYVEPYFNKHKTLVDLGCNIGTYALIFTEYFEKCIGVDFSKPALHQAKILAKKYNKKNYEFIAGDVSNLGLKNNSADVIIGCDIVEHLDKKSLNGMYNEAYRILRPGGRFIVQTYPSKYYSYYQVENKYGRIIRPFILLCPNFFLDKFLLTVDTAITLLSNIKAFIIQKKIISGHNNCQDFKKLKKEIHKIGFNIIQAFSENTYSKYEYNKSHRELVKKKKNHYTGLNNMYVIATKYSDG